MNDEKTDYAGCFTSLVENGVFILGALLMFSKTVDLMAAFAPKTMFGYVGVDTFYGLAVGLMVEGMLISLKITMGRPKNPIAWAWNILLILAPFIISALAQVFDSFYVRETLQDQPEEIQLFVTWFVPSIPTLIVGLFVGKAILASVPEGLFKSLPASSIKPVSASNTGKSGWSGFRGWLGGKDAPAANPTVASIKPKE